MRIIAGEYRGRIIKMPKDGRVRPTQDRVREAIFNVISKAVPGSKVLDLYAGSGAFGIEAISRGAELAVFSDTNIKCIDIVKSNIALLGIEDSSVNILKKDAIKTIESLDGKGNKFDLVFLDPPYIDGSIAKNTLIKIGACDILSGRSFVIAEHSAKHEMPYHTGSIRLLKKSKYGDTAVSFYYRSNP